MPMAGRSPDQSIGSNHIRYRGGDAVLRLSTDAPLSYIAQETAFPLTRPLALVFGPDEPFEGAIEQTAREFEEHTRDYWHGWVRSLAVPFEWQSAVIRAAITLQIVQLRGNRRHRRRAHHLDPRGAEQRAQLGLPLLLAA